MLCEIKKLVPAWHNMQWLRSLATLWIVALSIIGHGTETPQSVDMAILETAPSIDGIVDPAEWSAATTIEQPFLQIEPAYGEPSPMRTVVHIGQTQTSIYVAFELHDSEIERLAAAVSQRDGDMDRDDSIAILIDTFSDSSTAYIFRTNSLGTQLDGRIADNGRTVDIQWDASWESAASRQPHGWAVEMMIPFNILRYDAKRQLSWRANFVRTTPRRLETSMWSGPSETKYRVSSFGELANIQPPALTKTWQTIPYILGSHESGDGSDIEVGVDVRWRPSSRLGVDLTLNPDFALVEADVETINLSRFELLIPEKRPFFLEGSEMFRQRIRQFYSRRIGDITWGAKSNGTIGGTSFSALFTQEDILSKNGLNESTADYGVVRLQHSLARGSNIGFIAANRNFEGENSGSIGIDSTMFFTDTLGMTAQLLRAHGLNGDGGYAWFIRPAWDTAKSHFHIRYTNLDQDIFDSINAVGFLVDDDRKEVDTSLSHTFWFDEGPIEKILPSVNYNRYWSQEDVLRSDVFNASMIVNFRNRTYLGLQLTDEFKLFEKEFNNDQRTAEFGWDSRDGRIAYVFFTKGLNFDSDLELFGGGLEWLLGDRWRLSYELSRLRLTSATTIDDSTIHVANILYSFHRDLFLKLFVQSNSAIDKENVQLLWVWRFEPPFGSIQLAYQTGTSEQGQISDQQDTVFVKLAWVFS